MACNIESKTNGRKSELEVELLKVLKNENEAQLAYAKITGSDFKKIFGDWESNYLNPNGDLTPVHGEVMPNGEPKLFNKKGTTQYYFKLNDGTKYFLDREGLRAMFSPTDIKDITKFLLYQYANRGNLKSLNEFTDTENNSSKIGRVIDAAIASYKIEVNALDDSDAKQEWLDRIENVELYKEEFRVELINAIKALGETVIEIAEEDKGGGLNIQESIRTNPKTSATVNTKILLSQILDVKNSDVYNDVFLVEFEDGTYDVEDAEGNVLVEEVATRGEAVLAANKLSKTKEFGITDRNTGYLNTKAFLPLEEVWEVLQPLLSDIVTTGSGRDVKSSYGKMYSQLKKFAPVHPWMNDLMDKLDSLEKKDRYKLYEFVQAFTNTKINYYVTEFSKSNSSYKVINATSTNSRESQILDRWGNSFKNKFLGGYVMLTEEMDESIVKIKTKLGGAYLEFDESLASARNNSKDGAIPFDKLSDIMTQAADNYVEYMAELGMTGLNRVDIKNLLLIAGGAENQIETMSNLFKKTGYMIRDFILQKDKIFVEDGAAVNPFKSETILKELAQAAAHRDLDISESSILGNDNKNYYAYSNPTYVSGKIAEWKNDPTELKEMANDPYNKNSMWAKYLLGIDKKGVKENQAQILSKQRLERFSYGLANSFKSVGKNDGVDNTKITYTDQLHENIFKVLGSKIKGGKSYFSTITPADKSRFIQFEGLPLFESGIRNTPQGIKIHPNTVDLFVNYFTDEYNRMKKVMRENAEMDDNKKVKHYHGKGKNGSRSQLFPEFDFDSKNPEFQDLINELYNSEGLPFTDDSDLGLTTEQDKLLRVAIESSLLKRVQETQAELEKLDKIDAKLIKAYNRDMTALSGDYLVNGIISSVEYTKLFSGDPAYYKNLPDLIKRVPATYTDGLQLALRTEDDLKFNVAVVDGIEVASRYVDKIRDSLTDKSIADAYNNVNTTDAQAWITPRRWRFLKQRLGQWSPLHDKVFKKMMTGESLRPHELKVVAQPLKGVYFEKNNHIPTYLKYSQAVLIPSLVRGTPMEKLYDKMTMNPETNKRYKDDEAHLEIHEVITVDGVKVGAVAPTKINKGSTTDLADEFELNKVELTNKGWKLQQDLPIKTMHETNLGSQIQKNILEGLRVGSNYKIGHEEVLGAELLDRIHKAISNLSNLGKKDVSKRLGISNDKITNKEKLYDMLIADFREKGNENTVAALEKETPLDAIPQIRGRVDSVLMSIFNKAIVKISTEGGSYIQVSPFGLETIKKSGKISNVEVVDRYSNADLINNPDKIYVFGDNIQRQGKGGQAIIRDNENAFGIVTKEEPNRKPSAYMMDDFYDNNSLGPSNQERIDADIARIKKDGRTVVFPKDGLGTGLAKLKEKAPKTYEYLKKRLLEEFGFNNDTGEVAQMSKRSNIKIISDNYNNEALLPPRKGPDGQTLPGQAMIPHSLAKKILSKNGYKIDEITDEQWKNLFSGKAREIISYRIPNQGMSSNDTLEIVGILPAGMGDSIIGYDGIPAKTGSDFDIDKMFVMAPNLVYNKDTKQLEVLSEDNKQFFSIKNEKEGITEKESDTLEKQLAQNHVLKLYNAILQSPHTYDNMMTSIDSSDLKDDIAGNPKKGIKGLFESPAQNNMQFFSPINQLKTKMEYMSGKMGVALTANQLVDHASNQTLDIMLKTDLGIAGNGKFVAMDKPRKKGASIAQTLSEFLNAYVDIAKDPYISRGNHNDITANTTFMLIRAGVDMKYINRFIGQPILKEYVEIERKLNSIASGKLMLGDKAYYNAGEYLADKYGMQIDEKTAGENLKNVSQSKLESVIRGEKDKTVDSIVLNAFLKFKVDGQRFTEAVLAAKSDTKGSGGSPVDLIVNREKINKVINEGFVIGFEDKYKDTSLGTYRENAINWVSDVLEKSEILLSGSPGYDQILVNVTNTLGKGDYATNKKLADKISNGVYSYLMSNTEMFRDNRENFEELFVNLPLKIQEMKDLNSDNFLIKELEIQFRGGFNFIGINNKNKPTVYQNDIYRAWLDLYQDAKTKDLAVNLAKYAYSQSGFQPNLNQFFTYIPHEILKDNNMNLDVKGMFSKIMDVSLSDIFVEQFLRHNANDNTIVPRPKEIITQSLTRLEVPALTGDEIIAGKELPLFYSIANEGEEPSLFRQVGTDSTGTKEMYIRTFPLGYKAGKNKVFEYSYENEVKKSVVESNNLTSIAKLIKNDYELMQKDFFIIEKSVYDEKTTTLTTDETAAKDEEFFEENSTTISLSQLKLNFPQIKKDKGIDDAGCE